VVAFQIPASSQTRASTPSALWAHLYQSAPANSPYWGTQEFASPAVGDLFGDGQTEIVAAFPSGAVFVYDANGNVMPGWPVNTGTAIDGSPTLADLRGDGQLEILVASQNGYVYAFTGTGSYVPGWPQFGSYGQAVTGGVFHPGFLSSPVVGDLFGNGQRDVVATSLDHYLYAWNSAGGLLSGFPINLWDTAVDTPLLVDLYHSGRLDIVAGGDSAPGHPHLGAWYAFPPTGCSSPDASNPSINPNRCALPGWPQFVNDTPWSSPAGVNLRGDGVNRIVAGTGHYYAQTFHCACGQQLNVFNADGSYTQGWPEPTPAPTFGSVAVGNLLNNGQLQVIDENENGHLYAYNGNGYTLPGWPEAVVVGQLSSPMIAPVDGSGTNGVWAASGGQILGWNSTGNQVDNLQLGAALGDPNGAYAADSGPTIARISNAGCPGLCAVVSWTNAARNAWYLGVFPIPGTTNLPADSWPTFHGNMQRNGGMVPQATVTSAANGTTSATTDFNVSWALNPGSVSATKYSLWVHEASLGWLDYTTTTGTSANFTGLPGHTYDFFVDAQNSLGSAQLMKTAQYTVAITGGATHSTALPFKSMYAIEGTGVLEPASSAPLRTTGSWTTWNIVRGVAVLPSGTGGYVLDGYGGIHQFGNAPGLAGGPYWPGWDIARGIVVTPSGTGAYVLDAYGGIHPVGNAPAMVGAPYWGGWDIARGLVLTASGTGGYVLDGYGGVHPFAQPGHALPPPASNGPYWGGWDIARGLALVPGGPGGYVLDGYGGVHAFGGAQGVSGNAYWPGWDIARGVISVGNGAGYTVDGYGSFHQFGGAPGVVTPVSTGGRDLTRAVAIAP